VIFNNLRTEPPHRAATSRQADWRGKFAGLDLKSDLRVAQAKIFHGTRRMSRYKAESAQDSTLKSVIWCQKGGPEMAPFRQSKNSQRFQWVGLIMDYL
jgi:hypothetical protein